MAKIDKVRKISKAEDNNMTSVYNAHISKIDAQLPKDLRTTKKDRMYSNHSQAKYNKIQKTMMSPQTSSKIATLLAKKLSYKHAFVNGVRASNIHADNNSHSKKITPAISKQEFNKYFENYVQNGQSSAVKDGHGTNIGSYKSLLNDRKDHINEMTRNMFDYSGEKLSLHPDEFPMPDDTHDRVRQWGDNIHNDKDSQSILKGLIDARRNNPKPIPHTTFEDMGIGPNDAKRLSAIYKDAHRLDRASRDPNVVHRIDNGYRGQRTTWREQIDMTRSDTKRLLGLNTGAFLNSRVKGTYKHLYDDNGIYDTQNHKHLSNKVIGERALHLGERSPKAMVAYHPHLPKDKFVNLLKDTQQKDKNHNLTVKTSLKKMQKCGNRKISHVKFNHAHMRTHAHHPHYNDGPSMN